jgi:hypothetical protein
LALGGLSDEALAAGREAHDRWCGPRALRVRNDAHFDLAVRARRFDDRHAGVRGAQIDPDDFAHPVSNNR